MTAAYFYVTDGDAKSDERLRFSVDSLRRHVEDPLVFVCTMDPVKDGFSVPNGCIMRRFGTDVFDRYNGGTRLEKTDKTRFPLHCFLRFIVPLDETVLAVCREHGCDRLVYLDCDTEVTSPDFASIADEDLHGCHVGGCRDPMDTKHKRTLKSLLGPAQWDSRLKILYVNSGVLMYDVSTGPDRWNERDASAVFDAYRAYGPSLDWPDQHCLWLADGVTVAELPTGYNYLADLSLVMPENGVHLLHYAGSSKKRLDERVKRFLSSRRPGEYTGVPTRMCGGHRIVVTLIGCIEDLDKDPEVKRNLERMNAVIRHEGFIGRSRARILISCGDIFLGVINMVDHGTVRINLDQIPHLRPLRIDDLVCRRHLGIEVERNGSRFILVPAAENVMIRIVVFEIIIIAAVFAVFAGVVQNVEEYLRKPLGVAGDRRKILLRRNVSHGKTLVAKKLIVGVKTILDQRGKLHGGNVQRKAAVLNARKFQQLLDHFGEASRLAGNNLNTAARVVLNGLVVSKRFRPAGDGGERRAQLVGNGRNKLRLYALGL